MLRRLSVENYVLIDKLEMELDPHLNIITGETGAGKSILLGALGLLLGAKNDGSAMKDAARNCVVEGTFDLSGRDMEAFFAGNDLDYAPETTVTRMITPTGKSRAFINDLPVQLAQLREFGTRLIDIHSQHQNLILSSEEFRTSALDTVAGNGELLAQYAAQYTRLTELRRRLAALREAAADGRRDEEWLRFQSEELTAANLREGEQAAIEEELAVLENADRIGEVLTTLRNALDADETGVLTLLKNSENDLTRSREHFPAAGEYAARLHSVLEELKDIDNAVAADSERLDAPDQSLEWHAWYADADDQLWQIDMIHMPKGSAYDGYFERVADRIAAVLTDRTRETILRLKYETPEAEKIMGLEYYQAVLRDGVGTYAEFEAWRAAHPVTGILEWMP